MSDCVRPVEGELTVAGPTPGGPGVLLSADFTAATVTAVRHALAARVRAAGLAGDEADGFVLAAHELTTNAVRHGGGSGRLELRRLDDVLICEVTDQGGWADALPVQAPDVNVPGGRGLWLAHQLTGALLLTRRPDGVTAAVSVCVGPPAAAGPGGLVAASSVDPATDGVTRGEQR